MIRQPSYLLSFALLSMIALGLAACDRAEPEPERETRRAVDRALQATGTAKASFDATVAAAVAGTATALAEPSATPVGRSGEVSAPGGTVVVETLATPLATADLERMSEAELASALEAAVAAALAASESASEASRAATEDGRVEPGESLLVEIEIAGAEDWLEEAGRLLEHYASRYDALTAEAQQAVDDLEQELQDIGEAMEALQGWSSQAQARATEVGARVDAAIATARARATERSLRFEAWREQGRATLEALGSSARQTPRSRPGDLKAAIAKLSDFGRAVREGLADGEIDAVERGVIVELGAEAAAGLREHGGPLLQRIADDVDELIVDLESGDWDAVRERLRALEPATDAP